MLISTLGNVSCLAAHHADGVVDDDHDGDYGVAVCGDRVSVMVLLREYR